MTWASCEVIKLVGTFIRSDPAENSVISMVRAVTGQAEVLLSG